jgi:opacity protein-like surface antigen
MRSTPIRPSWFPVLFATLIVLGVAGRASAQGFISPFIGYNFGGDTGCASITDCEDRHANYGFSLGAVGSIVGFEEEFAWTNDFLGSSPLQSTKVLTLMSNLMIAPRIKAVQPYGLGGIGLIRTSIESVGSTQDENQIGWDVGGGVMVFFNAHVGVRGDVRYFHSFQILDLSRLPEIPQLPGGGPSGQQKLDYGRFAVAVVFRF